MSERRSMITKTQPTFQSPNSCCPPIAVFRLTLLGKMDFVIDNRSSPLPLHAQRLLAFLALQGGPVDRLVAALTLWPDVAEDQATAKLRSVLFRLHHRCAGVIACPARTLRISPLVKIDLHESIQIASQLLDRSLTFADTDLSTAMHANLDEDLLPHWHEEDWIKQDYTRFHQLRLHALEALCERLIDAQWYGAAVDAALCAVRAEPLRESARVALIRAYLAEGNQHHAISEYESYRKLVEDQLGLEPSTRMSQLASSVWNGRTGSDVAAQKVSEHGDPQR